MIFRPPRRRISETSGIIFKNGGDVKTESGHKKPRRVGGVGVQGSKFATVSSLKRRISGGASDLSFL